MAAYSFAFVPWIRGHQRKLMEDALPETATKFELFGLARERFPGLLLGVSACTKFLTPRNEAGANEDLLTGVDETMTVMHEEIFGPVLPVIPYGRLEEAIDYVNARPRPLALYVFEHDRRAIDQVIRGTVSGGVTVNETILHIAQDDLPFGGVGASGMGHYHGREGFETFSKRKAVFRQSRLNGLKLFRAPYGGRFERMLRLLLR